MNPRRRALLAGALATGGALPLLTGCAAAPGNPIERWAADAAALNAAMQGSVDAWNRGDLKGHLAIYDPAMTQMTKNGPRLGLAAMATAFEATYFVNGKPKQALRMEQIQWRRIAADAALCTGRFVLSGGGLPELSGWFTLAWQRGPEGWRAVHDHTS